MNKFYNLGTCSSRSKRHSDLVGQWWRHRRTGFLCVILRLVVSENSEVERKLIIMDYLPCLHQLFSKIVEDKKR